jgi:Cd2+/Zn2+-exporting ATPase
MSTCCETHEHHHGHDHSQGHLSAILFGIGLLFYILAWFIPIVWVQIGLFLGSVVFAGQHVIQEGIIETIQLSIQKKRFIPNIHVLMTLGALGAILIQEYNEAALLILIFAGAHFLESYAESKSKKEITSLLKLKPKQARLYLPNGETTIVDVETIAIGDVLLVLHGDQVPVDGTILTGETSIDQSAITGESIPVDKNIDDLVYGGTMNITNNFTMVVTKRPDETVFASILTLVKEAQRDLSSTAKWIQKIEPIYVTLVLIIAPLFYVLSLMVLKNDMQTAFYQTMVFLIGASPCALAATDIPATLSALSHLAKRGILLKGGSYVSNLKDIQAIAFDKTGTLTNGTPVVTDVIWLDETQLDVLIAMEKTSNHPLSMAILNYFQHPTHIDVKVTQWIGSGIEGVYQNQTFFVGKKSLFLDPSDEVDRTHQQLESDGKTVICFGQKHQIHAIIGLKDLPKASAQETIAYFKSQQVHTVMISGDAKKTAEAIGHTLGMDTVFGDVLPEEKSHIIEALKHTYQSVAMVGDGVNDAPALVKANIGFAMKQGTDIAMEVADGILMDDDLNKLVLAHKVSRKLRRIIIQNMVFAMAIVIFLIMTNLILNIQLSLTVFVHEGSTLLVILNGLRMLKPLS